jgi:hypothetical protein
MGSDIINQLIMADPIFPLNIIIPHNQVFYIGYV